MKLVRAVLLSFFITYPLFLNSVFAQETGEIIRNIIDCAQAGTCYSELERLKDLDFKNNNYDNFIQTLKNVSQRKKSLEDYSAYFMALARYHQLKYLEANLAWDEYFSRGDEYRKELSVNLQRAIDRASPQDKVYLYSRLLLWQFFKDQQDPKEEEALNDLIKAVKEYSGASTDAQSLKDIGDKLLVYGYKGKSKEVYRIYVEKITTSDIKDEGLYDIAAVFYKEGNLELAQIIYDVYIGRIIKVLPKEQAISVLIKISGEFIYKDTGFKDPGYAEKIFKRIEELAGISSFSQELMYLRAFNLEKFKDYAGAKDSYQDFIQAYPDSSRYNEAVFKLGIISAYIFRDIAGAKSYLDKISGLASVDPYVISALYQLGMLNQWQGDLTKAKEYYNSLIERSKSNGIFEKEADLAEQRLKEIESGEPLSYNLNILLDVSLKDEYAMLDMSSSSLKSSNYKVKPEDQVSLNLDTYKQESGCSPVALQYIWSGDTGRTPPDLDSAVFNTSYLTAGTKLIGVVIVGPSGVIGKSIDMVDVE
ncbi:MAG: tetratricopeptide repeat protein [Candidatus Omnitrophota bacterium]|nr:tetratricopeptide repeat protein [Candidatus Omnitrophota bacterium]MBU1929508.1 tetratricopeptide repeat protein [Candidatus Omnitrophota bacterium]MBU2035305.1 tetratricopeptide repeat protein [Candidatus Omnitrophota bacterium]MBU2221295.1 tetratricopeptide repeat protein [Candidatus Omnitrophota bacterium]